MTNRETTAKDILKDMKKHSEIYAHDKLFYRNGRFLKA